MEMGKENCFRRGNCQQELATLELIKDFANKKNLYEGALLHADILKKGLLSKSPYIACSLISMYVKCGVPGKAQDILEELPTRDVVCWNALISGYAQQGQGREALVCFKRLQREGLYPDMVTYICILKACGNTGTACMGKQLHSEILQKGLLDRSLTLGNALVDMYAKCGLFMKAQQVFHEIPVRNVITWSALISGYADHNKDHEALDLFELMQCEGLSPNEVTFICILKACGSINALDKGIRIHDKIVKIGLFWKCIKVGNALVDMYAKCGALAKAAHVLEELPVRNVVSWSILISGYCQASQGYDALDCFSMMQNEGLTPNEFTFACVLKACGSTGSIEMGELIYDEIVNLGLLNESIVLGNALVDMYVKCGVLSKAQKVVEGLPVRDVVSWSALIAGYAQNGRYHDAINCFIQMQKEGVSPNEVSFVCILKVYGSIGAIDKGKLIHKRIVERGLLVKNIVLGNALVDMYVKCNALVKARKILEELPVRNIVSWNALIAGFVEHGQGHEALDCFVCLRKEGLYPDRVTFTCVLKACGITKNIDWGRQIHDEIILSGLLKKDIVLGTALVDMYTKCGALLRAQQVLEELPMRDMVSWSALIEGYADSGLGHNALSCFEQMQREGLSANEVTFVSVLKACGSIRSVSEGKKIHDKIVERKLLGKDIALDNSLVDMYVKCGDLSLASKVLEDLPARNVVSWNAMISGYAQGGQGYQALKCFEQMQREGLSPDEATFTSLLKACGSIGAINKGIQIHDEIVNAGFLDGSILLGTALIDMYAKCGIFSRAQHLLEELPVRDTVSWSTLIAGYADEGHWREALNCFEQMQMEGFSPNEVTLISVLNACCHSGKYDEAQIYYENMHKKYGLTPTLEHHTCMLMIFGFAGHFDKALSVIDSISPFEDPSGWLCLLAASSKWSNVTLARLAFTNVMQLDCTFTSAFVLMCKMHAAIGVQEDAEKLEAMRMNNACCEETPGMSLWIDASGNRHSFSIANVNHVQKDCIYAKLKELADKMSVKCTVSVHTKLFEEDVHSEVCAIACALINTYETESIHIVKNISLSLKCHSVISCISRIERRRILVTDPNQIHNFENGECISVQNFHGFISSHIENIKIVN